MIDKVFCMSSYLAFRYIEKDDVDFYENLHHHNIHPISDEDKTLVSTAADIDVAIKKVFDELQGQKLGLMLSGGIDSANLASYMEEGQAAYTFRFLGGNFQTEELQRAEFYAKSYGLKLHYVDIDWNTVRKYLEPVMKAKNAPVHSIEPQLYQAALQAKSDGIERIIVGESSDLVFGGMDSLLAKDWTVEEFKERYTFTNPAKVLKQSADISYLFERYRKADKIDFLSFMDDVFSIESSSSYLNAFGAAGMPYTDPYAKLKMKDKLDLYRVRNGEPKYLIRNLFSMKYPERPIPDKIPMPRPVDTYFSEWKGPKRPEFREDINLEELSGNQKWQLYCLEKFLDMYE